MVDFFKIVVKDLHLIVDVKYFFRWKTTSLWGKYYLLTALIPYI
jgi:hypothetical protein